MKIRKTLALNRGFKYIFILRQNNTSKTYTLNAWIRFLYIQRVNVRTPLISFDRNRRVKKSFSTRKYIGVDIHFLFYDIFYFGRLLRKEIVLTCPYIILRKKEHKNSKSDSQNKNDRWEKILRRKKKKIRKSIENKTEKKKK